jgi:fibronectin type 3 domain-containing protein
VTLSWSAGAGADSFNVYRGTAAGGETLYRTGVASPTFVDDTATNGVTYFYRVTAVNSAGEGTASNEVSATPTPGPAPVYRIACGHPTDVPPFQRDQYFTGGGTTATGQTIDLGDVANPAPSAVYQYVRYSNFSYLFPNLTPGAPYTVRLHFAEAYAGGYVSDRVFDVAINGATVLPSFDITAVAGGQLKALVEQFNVTADASGQIAVAFTGINNSPILSGIEILTGSARPSAPFGLRAVPGDGQMTLSWSAGAGATAFNVYRGTAAGAETLYRAGVQALSFVDDTAANGVTYYYTVTAVDAVGESPFSNEASATPTAGPAPVYRIACGHPTDVPPYQRDQYFTGGGATATGQTIDRGGVANPAPAAVYQYVRYANFSYLFPNLAPGAPYTVRLHFEESYTGAVGNRLFDVAINGATVLPSFDVLFAAGHVDKAIVEQFNAAADASGQISLVFTSIVNPAMVSGIEILTGSSVASAPYGLRGQPGDNQVRLFWQAGLGATSFNVYRGTSPGTQTLYQAGVTAPSFVDTAAANDTSYYYTVTAVNEVGEGPPSAEVIVMPGLCPAVFAETWDGGTSRWRSLDGSPIALVDDGPACGAYQRESVSASGGRAVTIPGIPVIGGAPYCLTSWIRGGSGASPFLGVRVADANGSLIGAEHWLIGGDAGYPTGYGDTVTPVTSNGDWAWYAKPFTMDAHATFVVLEDENHAAGTADFDTIQLVAGACPAAPVAACTAPAATCSSN